MRHSLSLFILLFTPALTRADELWIGCYFGDNIKRYDLGTGSLKGTVGVGRLDGPLGMVLGPGGHVYATSEITGSIEKFDRAGNWLGRFGTANSPTGIVFDHAKNSYVAQFNTDSVVKLSPTGSLLGDFIAPGTGGLNGPDLGITFGPDGNLYVPSFETGDVMRYNGATGAFIDKFLPAGSGGLTQPRQMIWRGGKIYVTSDNGSKVLRYDAATGAFIDTFIAPGSGGLNGAAAMAFHGNSLYLTSWRNNRILKFNANSGAFQSVFVSSGLSGPVSLLVVKSPESRGGLGNVPPIEIRRSDSKR